ncbi:MAG: DNA repair exonuclease [Faecalicatena sp.]|uniref:metallophosphoesterase family protein n=1 Tax=Faecalicatena sp. TaxID=2005360 RepID=UPI00258CAEB0|nr:DNA repair exonuclease [Faecalicatena sp.]MCI6465399.1 DNA repair exonuclease [Faecalicatena sp.]MDY5617231.1 DNA repair exonuclease [Lachnospiraceae bacterium]
MRFIHIADVHLGAQPDAGTAYSSGRAQEIWDSFSRVISLCEEEKTDVLLIAGDLFHRQPLLRELKEVNYLFSTLSHTQVVLIAGNHDYIKKGSYYRTFQWCENVHPLFGSEMGYVMLKEYDLAVYGLSYHTREIREERYSIKAPLAAAHEILLAHGGDEKHIPIRKEILENAGFDYIALGHIHKPQAVIRNMALYAGALEPVDQNDTGGHGFVRGEITENGVNVEFIPFASREYIHLALRVNEKMTNGSVKNHIQSTIESRGTQNIYKFILRGYRDADVEFDTEHMDIYGNILEIENQTQAAYNYEELYEQNRDNLIGKFIEQFQGYEEDSMEYQALQEGVQALLENCLR